MIFEGEYLNDIRYAKGKEFYDKWTVRIWRVYLEGEKNGNGKEYHKNGKLKFEGSYIKGNKWNGIGNDYEDKKSYENKEGEEVLKEYYENGILNFERRIFKRKC